MERYTKVKSPYYRVWDQYASEEKILTQKTLGEYQLEPCFMIEKETAKAINIVLEDDPNATKKKKIVVKQNRMKEKAREFLNLVDQSLPFKTPVF